ncbi:hypothetical protein LINPERHAP1_LOCUS5780, partial [Linum perenne]
MDSQKTCNSNDAKADGSIICRCSPIIIYNLIKKTSDDKIARLTSLRFGGTTKVGITQLPTKLRRWVLDIYDVDTQAFKVGPEMTLTITEEDLYKVYELPRGAKEIELDKTTKHVINALVGACGLKFAKGSYNIHPEQPGLNPWLNRHEHHSKIRIKMKG